MMKIMNKFKLALLLTVLVLTACEKAEDLETSVNSRWNGIISNELDKAYSYYSPGYKEVESLEGFKLRILTAQLNIKWTQGTFKSAECSSEDVCEVRVEVTYNYSFSKRSLGGVENMVTELKENWIKIDGKWVHVPKK